MAELTSTEILVVQKNKDINCDAKRSDPDEVLQNSSLSKSASLFESRSAVTLESESSQPTSKVSLFESIGDTETLESESSQPTDSSKTGFGGCTQQISKESRISVDPTPSKKIRLSEDRKSFPDHLKTTRPTGHKIMNSFSCPRFLDDFDGSTQQISKESRVSTGATASKKIRLSKGSKSFPEQLKTAQPAGHKIKNSLSFPRFPDDHDQIVPNKSTGFPTEARVPVEATASGAQGTSSCTGDREGNEPPESLYTVLDGDGNIYHAFMEVCNIVFSGTPRQTIKSRMRTLGLNLVRCPVNVQEKVRKARPQLAGFKVISLIAKRDVAILDAYHQSRAPNERSKFVEPCSPNPQESSANVEKNRPRSALLKVKRDFSPEVRGGKFSAIPSVNAISQNVLIEGNRSSVETMTTMHPTVSGVATARTSKTQASPKYPGSESDDECSQYKEEEECFSSDDDDDSDDSHVEGNLPEDQFGDKVVLLLKKRKLDSTQFKRVVKEMKPMHIFYASEYNYKRRSPRMTDSTWTKHVERLVTFFSYTSDVFNRTPALALVDDMELVESFLKYLETERRIQHSTAARYVHSLLIAAKYIHVDNSRKDYEGVDSVNQLRTLRQQLEKAQTVHKSMPSARLFWPQYQELVRSLFRKYEEASGAVKARLHMNFTMLLLFSVNPGRAKELRSLRLLTDVKGNRVEELVKRIPHGDNVILFSNSGSVSLIEKGYKTVSKYGTNVVEFDSEFQFLTYHLREYSVTSRPKLLPRGAVHDYYFVNKSGMPFNSSGSFSKYLSRLFKQHLGFPCAINEMRHSLVEHFRSLPESSDTKLAESLARVCKHNLRTQINIYDRRTEPERISQALRYLNRSAENFILDEAPGTSADLATDEEERDDLPSPGEMCALVPSDASFDDPTVLLAKVLKYTADGKNARLAWLKELESRPNHFEFQVGTDVWQEKSTALIYPVDVTYHRSDGIYELRTPKERIYALVRN